MIGRVGSITFVTPVAAIGGAERALLDLLGSFRSTRPAVTTRVLVGEDGPLVDALRELTTVEVLALPTGLQGVGERSFSLAGLRGVVSAAFGAGGHGMRLRRTLQEHAPDVIHTNGMKSHVLGTLAAAGTAPVVWHVRDFVGQRRWAPRLLRVVSWRATGAITVSRAVARDLEECRLGLRTVTVHDAVDIQRFRPGADGALLDELGGAPTAPAGTIRMGLIATYSVWKGHRVFLEAASMVARDLPVRFYVVGGPIYHTPGSQLSEAQLRRWASELGLGDRLVIVPLQRDPAPVYRALDAVVHASTTPEPFGLTIAEAMSSGRAVIASRAAGCIELLEEGADALTFPPGDIGALAEAMERLARDPARREALGARARELATRRLDRGRLAAGVMEAYAVM